MVLTLMRGQRAKLSDLTSETRLKLNVHVEGPDAVDVVYTAVLLDEKQVAITPTSVVSDDQPVSACGSVTIRPRSGTSQCFELDLSRVPSEAASVLVSVGLLPKKRSETVPAIQTGYFSVDASGSTVARYDFTKADLGSESAIMLGEVYRKGGAWRVRSVGDGFAGGLAAMLSRFRITPGAVSSTSGSGSLVLAPASAGHWLPKGYPGGVQPTVPKDLTRSVGLTITRSADGAVHTGTGFMISPGGLFVTCHHVVFDAVDLSISVGGSNSLRKANVVALDEDSDLALCCVDDRNGAADWLVPAGPDATPGLGDELGLLGFPLGVDLGMSVTYSQGIVNSLRKKSGVSVLQIDVGAAPGSSGGPVFRRSDGQVVGVLTSGLNFADRGMLINFAVDIRTLWSLGWIQRM